MADLDFSRCRSVWVPDDSEAGGFWSPPPWFVQEGVRFIVEHPFALIGTEMGGMKTAQAIIAGQMLYEAGEVDRLVIVATASVAPKVWFDPDLGQIREQLFVSAATITHYHAKIKQWHHGDLSAKSRLMVIVTNYEYIRSEANLQVLLPYCGLRTMLVLDESSAVRGHDSAQTEAVLRLRWLTNKRGRPVYGARRCGRVVLLNGTPLAESPLDVFSQANIMHPSVLDCRYVTHFKSRYAVQQPVLGAGGRPLVRHGRAVQEVAGWANLDDLMARMAPHVLRRTKEEFGVDFALPPVGLDVALTQRTWDLYRSLRDETVAWLETGVCSPRQAGVRLMRLAQLTSGFLGGVEDPGLGEDLFDVSEEGLKVVGETASGRVEEVGREKLDFALSWQRERLRRDPRMKLLTWCRFVPELRRYLEAVRAEFGHPVGACCGESVLGGTKRAEREAAVRMLHPRTAPEGAATVGATQGTGALGLNFTACRTVLDMSYDFSPWKKSQGDARVNRSGQTGPVSFFYLVAVGPRGQKTVDHHVMLTRLGKAEVNDYVTAGWARRLRDALVEE